MLQQLPPELVIYVLSLLDYASICTCQRVCRFLAATVRDSACLQYGIQLAIAGFKDGNQAGSASDRLERLQMHQDAWRSLKHSESASTHIDHMPGGLYELYDCVLAQGAKGDGSVHFTQLPSALRDIQRRDWAVENSDIKMLDFGICPAQDLLVAISTPDSINTQHIHLRTMSTGVRHPACAQTQLAVPIDGTAPMSYNIQVSDDYLGILFQCRPVDAPHTQNNILVWEWRTGELKTHISSNTMQSFIFLGDEHILLSTISAPENIFAVDLIRVDFTTSRPTPTILEDVPVTKFCLPALHPNAIPIAFDLRCDPVPASNRRTSEPFSTDGKNRITVATLWVEANVAVTPWCIVFAIPLSTLCTFAKLASPCWPWNEWGPEGSRLIPLIPGQISQNWVCCVFESKYVVRRPPLSSAELEDESVAGDYGDDPLALTVYDFNQLSCKKAIHDGKKTRGTYEIVNTPSSLLAIHEVFEEDVETRLPFQAKSIPLRNSVRAAMISADSLIYVESALSVHGQYRVLSF